MPRNDNRTPAPNVFGKPGKSYVGDLPVFPLIVETRTANQETPVKPIGTPHDRITGAILISQRSENGDNNDCVITETYETLPGPWLPTTRWDDDLGQIYGRRRAELANPSTQVSDLAQFQKIVRYEAREGSAIVSWRYEENYSNGTGTGVGNEVYPIKKSELYDVQRGNVQRTKQLVISASQISSKVLVSTTVTETDYQTYEPSKFFLFEVIDTFVVPGPGRIGSEMSDECQGNVATIFKQLLAYTAAEVDPDVGYLKYTDVPIDAVTKERQTLYAEHGFPAQTEIFYDMSKNGAKVQKVYQLVDSSTSPGSPHAGYMQEVRKTPNHLRVLLITTTWDTPPGPYYERIRTAYSFPNLFDPIGYSWSDACGAFGQMNSERKVMTFFIAKHQWFTSFPDEQTYFVLHPITHMVGRGWQAFLETINNELEYDYSGSCSAAYIFVASDPDLDTYLGLIDGDPQLMTEQCELDPETLLYHRISYYLHMQ